MNPLSQDEVMFTSLKSHNFGSNLIKIMFQNYKCSISHDGSMCGIYANIGGLLMVNVSIYIYSIHGSIWILWVYVPMNAIRSSHDFPAPFQIAGIRDRQRLRLLKPWPFPVKRGPALAKREHLGQDLRSKFLRVKMLPMLP